MYEVQLLISGLNQQEDISSITVVALGSDSVLNDSRIKRRFGSDMRTVQRESLLVGGLTSVLRGRVGEWKMEAGADGQWNAVESTARFEDLASGLEGDAWTRYADGGSTMSTWGAFASAHVERGKHAFRGGLRYSHASVHSSFEDTTRLSLPFGEVNQQGGALTASGYFLTTELLFQLLELIVE